MTKMDGLLDVIAVGCILEFSTALNRLRYRPGYFPASDSEERSEEEHARTRFRLIMKAFAEQFFTTFDHIGLVHPSFIWKRILVRFAAAVVTYRKVRDDVVPEQPGMTTESITAAFRAHLQADHRELLPCFESDLQQAPDTLTWDGPSISIFHRNQSVNPLQSAMGVGERVDIQEYPGPLYLNKDDGEESSDGAWSGDDEEDGQ